MITAYDVWKFERFKRFVAIQRKRKSQWLRFLRSKKHDFKNKHIFGSDVEDLAIEFSKTDVYIDGCKKLKEVSDYE